MPSSTSRVLELDGTRLLIPLTNKTHPFCWKHAYIGVLLDSDGRWSETSEGNNVGFYRIIFDCGGRLNHFIGVLRRYTSLMEFVIMYTYIY